MSFQTKNKILIILPTNHNQSRNETLKITELMGIIQPLEKENFSIKLATYRGEKPFFNFEGSESYKEWLSAHDEQLSMVSNIDNINSDIFDAVIIPSYLYIYKEIEITDYNLVSVINSFVLKDKIVVVYEHSSYVLTKCTSGDLNAWPLIGYNISGISFEKSLLLQEEYQIPNCEEEITLLGGNYLKNEGGNRGENKEIFCFDKGILSGSDGNSLKMMMICLISKLNN